MADPVLIIEKSPYLFNIIRRRVGAVFSHTFAPLLNYQALPPETINIFPTDRCNLRCKMCFEKFRIPKKELKIEQWKSIIDQVSGSGPRIHLSGGEPLLYPDIDKLLEYIKRHKLFLVLTTNGTYLKKFTSIIAATVNQINISIDGPAEIHDKIRGVAGTFNQILDGINEIKKKKRKPRIKIHSMINFENPLAMQKIVDIARSLHIDEVKFLYPLFADKEAIEEHRHFLKNILGRELNYWREAYRVAPKPENFTNIQKVFEKIKKNTKITINIFPRFSKQQFLQYYKPGADFYSVFKGRCRAPWNTATILPDGEVESCPDYILGSLINEKFLHLWNNKKNKNLRIRIKNREFFSVCRACCFFYY